MGEYGIDNVRGGSIMDNILSQSAKKLINKMIVNGKYRSNIKQKAKEKNPNIKSNAHKSLNEKYTSGIDEASGKRREKCSRCKRYGHNESACYAKSYQDGNSIEEN